MNKKNRWLSQIKAKAEELQKAQSVDDVLNEFEKEKVPYHWHIITWMSFGVAATIFISTFFETLQENKMLKARLTESEIRSPYQNASMRAFDLYEVVPDLTLPPTMIETTVRI